MKTAARYPFEAARFARLVTVTRQDAHLTFAAGELDTLIDVLSDLRDGVRPEKKVVAAQAEPSPPAEPQSVVEPVPEPMVEELPPETVANVLDTDDADADGDETESAKVTSPRPPRRNKGALWAIVSDYLSGSPKAKSFYTILRHIETSDYAGGKPEHALKILLGRRVGRGDVLKSEAGRYKLADGVEL